MSADAAVMKRVGRRPDLGIGDPRTESVIASWWTLADSETADLAGESALAAMPAAEGLLRFSVFRSVVGAGVFLFSQWASHKDRDGFLAGAATAARGTVDDQVGDVVRDRVLGRRTVLATDVASGADLLLVTRTGGAGDAPDDPATSTFRSDDGSETVSLITTDRPAHAQAFRWVGAVEPQ